MPEYSERGEGTAGCLINDRVWVDRCIYGFFNNSCDGLSVVYDTIINSTTIAFSGSWYSAGEDSGFNEGVGIHFIIENQLIRNNPELIAYLADPLVIDGNNVRAELQYGSGPVIACDQGIVQQEGLLFLRSQGVNGRICAGTFGFESVSNCGHYRVFSGRYDYLLNRNRFRPAQ
jgi:hypothetical protein